MIYVVGVDHRKEQRPDSMNIKERVERLQSFVHRFCREKSIQLIAEEWCDDARRIYSTNTYAENIAAEFKIEHLACDPGIADRERLQLKSRQQIAQENRLPFPIEENEELERAINETPDAKEADRKREQYWLDQIVNGGHGNKNILFICGYGHADSFVALLKSKGYDAIKVAIS